MELRRENILSPDGRGELHAVTRAAGGDRVVLRLRIKAVYEINVATVLDTLKNRALRLDDLDLIPADLRNLQSLANGEMHHAARK